MVIVLLGIHPNYSRCLVTARTPGDGYDDARQTGWILRETAHPALSRAWSQC